MHAQHDIKKKYYNWPFLACLIKMFLSFHHSHFTHGVKTYYTTSDQDYLIHQASSKLKFCSPINTHRVLLEFLTISQGPYQINQFQRSQLASVCLIGEAKKKMSFLFGQKIKGTVVLMQKNVLDINTLLDPTKALGGILNGVGSILDTATSFLGRSVSLQLISATEADCKFFHKQACTNHIVILFSS